MKRGAEPSLPLPPAKKPRRESESVRNALRDIALRAIERDKQDKSIHIMDLKKKMGKHLAEAVERGDLELVESLVTECNWPDVLMSLSFAAANGDTNIVDCILSKGKLKEAHKAPLAIFIAAFANDQKELAEYYLPQLSKSDYGIGLISVFSGFPTVSPESAIKVAKCLIENFEFHISNEDINQARKLAQKMGLSDKLEVLFVDSRHKRELSAKRAREEAKLFMFETPKTLTPQYKQEREEDKESKEEKEIKEESKEVPEKANLKK